MRSIIAVLLLTFIGLQYKLWLGDASVLHGIYLEKKLLAQAQENEKLNVRNRTLEADILELKHGDQALEELARFELGMIKNNEVYYQFIE